MIIKKNKKSLFSSSILNSFVNKKLLPIILKFFGIILIFLVFSFLYLVVTKSKDEIRKLVYLTAQKSYWIGSYISNTPKKWLNNFLSDDPVLNISINSKDYQLLMTLKDDAVKKGILLEKNKRSVPALLSYKNQSYDVRIRLKGVMTHTHLQDHKWSSRIKLNNERFLGMKEFSLQNPKRRSFVSSFLLHKFSESANLPTKKFDLIPFSINGKYMGVYNYEEFPDHNMNDFLSGKNNIVIVIDDDDMFIDQGHVISNFKNLDTLPKVNNYYLSSKIRAHSLNEVLNDKILKKDFEKASKLLNDFRSEKLPTSEVFDLDKTATWLALTDLFGSYHGSCFSNIKLVYDRDKHRLYPIIWDAFGENLSSSITHQKYRMFKLQYVFDLIKGGCTSKIEMPSQMLQDTKLIEKYLNNLDQVTSIKYIDNILKRIKPQTDEYMRILNLDYPQIKIETEIRRLKDNAKYLRDIFLYPKQPFEAYLPADEEKNSLILVNTSPVPFKIIGLIDVTTNQKFIINSNNPNYILKNYIGDIAPKPTKLTFECPIENCFAPEKINNMRIITKVLGTTKNSNVKINNWVAYE